MRELRPIGTKFILKGSSYNLASSGNYLYKVNEQEQNLLMVVIDHLDDDLGRTNEIITDIKEGQCYLCFGFHGDNSNCMRS